MNRSYPPNGGRGGRGYQQQFQPNMPHQSPQMYNARPHQQHMGRGGMAPTFQPQNAMQQNSPYRQNRSPAITPATMHSQAQYVAGASPYYQGQPGYGQPVRINSTIPTLSSVAESSKSTSTTAAPRSFPTHPANSTELDFRVPSNQPDPFSQHLDSHFSSSTSDFEHYLTKLPHQNMYGMPPQVYDQSMYGGGYGGLQQSIHYPGMGMPASPGFRPQQMQPPYGGPGPYQPQAMSRTPSNMSERPSSAVPQPSTPAMTNVNHINHSHTPSVTSASPAPSSTFERPKKRSAAILIKKRMYRSPALSLPS
jgi:translation initiation factor 4G